MEDNRQDKDLKQAEKNTGTGEETSGKTSRKTRHTWIGDKDEIRPDGADRPVTRMTIPDAGARGTKMISTKVVERPKKPYRGFITAKLISNASKTANTARIATRRRNFLLSVT